MSDRLTITKVLEIPETYPALQPTELVAIDELGAKIQRHAEVLGSVSGDALHALGLLMCLAPTKLGGRGLSPLAFAKVVEKTAAFLPRATFLAVAQNMGISLAARSNAEEVLRRTREWQSSPPKLDIAILPFGSWCQPTPDGYLLTGQYGLTTHGEPLEHVIVCELDGKRAFIVDVSAKGVTMSDAIPTPAPGFFKRGVALNGVVIDRASELEAPHTRADLQTYGAAAYIGSVRALAERMTKCAALNPSTPTFQARYAYADARKRHDALRAMLFAAEAMTMVSASETNERRSPHSLLALRFVMTRLRVALTDAMPLLDPETQLAIDEADPWRSLYSWMSIDIELGAKAMLGECIQNALVELFDAMKSAMSSVTRRTSTDLVRRLLIGVSVGPKKTTSWRHRPFEKHLRRQRMLLERAVLRAIARHSLVALFRPHFIDTVEQQLIDVLASMCVIRRLEAISSSRDGEDESERERHRAAGLHFIRLAMATPLPSLDATAFDGGGEVDHALFRLENDLANASSSSSSSS